MKAFDDVIKLVREAKKEYLTKPDPAIVKELQRIGREAIRRAVATRETMMDLGNQGDAYGYGIYLNQQLISNSLIDKSHNDGATKADRKRKKWGRAEAMRWPHLYTPESKGYVLVIFNAMWYSNIHENGWPGHAKLRIISQEAPSAMAEIEKTFGVMPVYEFLSFDNRQ